MGQSSNAILGAGAKRGEREKAYYFALNSYWLKVSWGTGEFGVHSLAQGIPTFFSTVDKKLHKVD